MTELSTIISNFVISQLSLELSRQGHNLTGDLIKSFETKVIEKTDSISIEFLMNRYGLSLEYGIKPSRIPYTPPPPYRGGRSKYIEGLIKFALLKFTGDKRIAKNIAFAIAAKHKKFGYPLTGKIGFITNTLEANMDNIERLIQDYLEAMFNTIFDEIIKSQIK